MRSHDWRQQSSNSQVGSCGSDPAADRLTEHLGTILRDWPSGCGFSAHALLRSYPSLRHSSSAVVAVAAEEYLRHRRAGTSIDVQAFAATFGDLEASVLRAAEVMEFFLQEPHSAAQVDRNCWPTVGHRFEHFELLEELGGGPLSRVYVARDDAVAGRHVVVKLTRSSEREILALGRLAHPGIVPILSISADASNGLTAVVMPFQSRVTLYDVIRLLTGRAKRGFRGRFADELRLLLEARNSLAPRPAAYAVARGERVRRWQAEWVAEIGAALADALHCAHAQGLLHCDVKPTNVVLVSAARPMLVDFNLCVGNDARRVAVGGTIPYMSPEQLCGAPLDARADVFSLAATLYHALTGAPPFGPPDQTISQALSARVALREQRSPQFLALAGIDVALAPAILKGLALEPGDRFQTAAAFAEALRSCVRPPARVARALRRRRKQAAALAGSAALLASAVVHWELTRDPLHIRATTAGIAAAGRHDFDECLRLSDLALRSRPDFVPALVLRGDAQLRRGDLELAYRDLKRAGELTDAPDVHALRSYAVYRLTQNDTDGMRAMQQALAAGVAPAILHNNLGYCLYRNLRFDDSLAELNKAVQIDPALGVAWLNLATVDWRLAVRTNRRPDTRLIEQALACCPDSCDAHYVAAQVYVQDALAGGASMPLVKLHCQEALKFGLPRSHIDALLSRLPAALRSTLAAELEDGSTVAYAATYLRTERFLMPVDGHAVAAQLLEVATGGAGNSARMTDHRDDRSAQMLTFK